MAHDDNLQKQLIRLSDEEKKTLKEELPRLIKYGDEILELWTKSYSTYVGSNFILPIEHIEELANKKLDLFFKSIEKGVFIEYYDNAGELGYILARAGVEYDRVFMITHYIQDSWTRVLSREYKSDALRLAELIRIFERLVYSDFVTLAISYFSELRRELENSEKKYRELFENANDVIYTHDLFGRFKEVNNAGIEFIGYDREDIGTLDISKVLTPEGLAIARKQIEDKAAGRPTKQPYELEVIKKDGTRVVMELKTRIIKDEDGKPIGVQGIGRDVTELRRMEKELAELKDK